MSKFLKNFATLRLCEKQLFKVLLFINCLLFTGLLVLSQVVDQTKNEGGIIASSSREQLFTAIKDAMGAFKVPKGVLKDIEISPDNQRFYTIFSGTTDGYISAYSLLSTDTDPVAALTFDDSSVLSQIESPQSLAISRDASLAFIAGDNRVQAINIKQITVYDAETDSSVVKNIFDWEEVVSVDETGNELTRNYTKIAVGPSGKYLYYLADFNVPRSTEFTDDTVFGEFGRFLIDSRLDVISTQTSAPDSPVLNVLSGTQFRFSFAKELKRPSGQTSFTGPFAMAISSDENYALVSAEGRINEGTFDPVLGHIPGKDDDSGGILVLDLQHDGDYLQHIPTLTAGEDDLTDKLNAAAQEEEFPVITAARHNLENEVRLAAALTAVSGIGGGAGGAVFVGTRTLSNAAELAAAYEFYAETYKNYGILSAYRDLYPQDMVGASGIGIHPLNNVGLVAMKSTNNLGILTVSQSSAPGGYTGANRPEFSFKTATEKTINNTELLAGTDFYTFLSPVNVALTANGSGAYVGMVGGPPSVDKHVGYVNVNDLTNEIACQTATDLSGSAVSKNQLRLIKPNRELGHSKHVATFLGNNADNDLLSDHVEANNRFNAASANLVSNTSAVEYNGDSDAGTFLPVSGLGYRHNGSETANVGKPSLLTVIECVGRIWHDGYVNSLSEEEDSVYSSHPYFVIRDMSAPGWEDITADGVNLYSSPREGDIMNILYFRKSGSDDPFDFVPSNSGTEPVYNINAISTSDEIDDSDFDKDATHELINLLLNQPEVTEIAVDPAAAAGLVPADGTLDSRIIIRGESDSLDPGSRRDMDAWFQVKVKTIGINLHGFVSDVPVSDANEQRPQGPGVLYEAGNTKLSFTSSESENTDFKYWLNFVSDDIEFEGITNAATQMTEVEVTPDTDYPITDLTSFTDVKLVTEVLDEPYSEDSVSISGFKVDLQAKEYVSGIDFRIIPEDEEEDPGVFIDTSTSSILFTSTKLIPRKIGQTSGYMKLFFDRSVLAIVDTMDSDITRFLAPGFDVDDNVALAVDPWRDDDICSTEIVLRGFDNSGNFISEDKVLLYTSRVDSLTAVKSDNTSVSLNTAGDILCKDQDQSIDLTVTTTPNISDSEADNLIKWEVSPAEAGSFSDGTGKTAVWVQAPEFVSSVENDVVITPTCGIGSVPQLNLTVINVTGSTICINPGSTASSNPLALIDPSNLSAPSVIRGSELFNSLSLSDWKLEVVSGPPASTSLSSVFSSINVAPGSEPATLKFTVTTVANAPIGEYRIVDPTGHSEHVVITSTKVEHIQSPQGTNIEDSVLYLVKGEIVTFHSVSAPNPNEPVEWSVSGAGAILQSLTDTTATVLFTQASTSGSDVKTITAGCNQLSVDVIVFDIEFQASDPGNCTNGFDNFNDPPAVNIPLNGTRTVNVQITPGDLASQIDFFGFSSSTVGVSPISGNASVTTLTLAGNAAGTTRIQVKENTTNTELPFINLDVGVNPPQIRELALFLVDDEFGHQTPWTASDKAGIETFVNQTFQDQANIAFDVISVEPLTIPNVNFGDLIDENSIDTLFQLVGTNPDADFNLYFVWCVSNIGGRVDQLAGNKAVIDCDASFSAIAHEIGHLMSLGHNNTDEIMLMFDTDTGSGCKLQHVDIQTTNP